MNAQHRGSALWITFDRPDKLNIMHPEDLSERSPRRSPGRVIRAARDQGPRPVGHRRALLPAYVGLSKAREMTGDIYTLDQLPPDSIANVVAEPDELDTGVESLPDRIATHPPAVTAAQRRLFDSWLNNSLDASVNASMTEFANVFASQGRHDKAGEPGA